MENFIFCAVMLFMTYLLKPFVISLKYSGPILESKGMREIFQKMGKKGGKC